MCIVHRISKNRINAAKCISKKGSEATATESSVAHSTKHAQHLRAAAALNRRFG
jgi:hypothetical protein